MPCGFGNFKGWLQVSLWHFEGGQTQRGDAGGPNPENHRGIVEKSIRGGKAISKQQKSTDIKKPSRSPREVQ